MSFEYLIDPEKGALPADHVWRGAARPEDIFDAAVDFVRRVTTA